VDVRLGGDHFVGDAVFALDGGHLSGEVVGASCPRFPYRSVSVTPHPTQVVPVHNL
jgi:hypothetical protein